MKKLKVGDRVEAIGKVAGAHLGGRLGVVIKADNDPDLPVLVEFDEVFELGHDGLGDGNCKDGHGRWGRHEDFRVVKKD